MKGKGPHSYIKLKGEPRANKKKKEREKKRGESSVLNIYDKTAFPVTAAKLLPTAAASG
jgi:hypothetical protein